ncbi:MAG: peptide chain release factor 2 [Kiritimatiellae bacterium]|nr:peptide chain release factor 2 [Kiritimatiellia bacterium]
MKKCEVIFDVAHHEEALHELDEQAASPDFWNDGNEARKVIEKANRHRAVVKPFNEVKTGLEDVDVFLELSEEGGDEGSLREAAAQLQQCEKLYSVLEMQSLLAGRFDAKNAYLTLHAGAGGTESCDWAEMLLRMYSRYCETHGFDLEIAEFQPGDEAGIKSVTVLVSGLNAYGYLSAERGVHRLVRISPYDSNKRRHTSFAALDVVAELDDDVELDIAETDLKIDTYRASGAGGQHVNTTDSAVRITHLPTGIVVACQAERSQHKNRAKAMKMLRSKVYEWTEDQKRKDMEKFYGEKGEISWGSQIRSYVMQPYTMVKDHRTSAETSNVQAVLDGDIQMFIEACLKKRAKDRAVKA